MATSDSADSGILFYPACFSAFYVTKNYVFMMVHRTSDFMLSLIRLFRRIKSESWQDSGFKVRKDRKSKQDQV